MIADGMGSCCGALFGSIVPTTCYIGHSRHKAIGATAGYSLLNGMVYFVVCLSGLLPVIAALVDECAVATSLVIVGLMIVQDAVELTHPRHVPAFCCGLFFWIADPWFFDMRSDDTKLCSLVTTQILCDLTDGKFLKCGLFCVVATFLSLFGLMHGNNPVEGDGSILHFGTSGEGELTVSFMDGDNYKVAFNSIAQGWFGPVVKRFNSEDTGYMAEL